MSSVIPRILYPTPPPSCHRRTKPIQVLALGLSRTGTESLKRALVILGYDHVYHGFDWLKSPSDVHPWVQILERKIAGAQPPPTARDFDAIIGHCEAVSDLPCCALGAELMHAYPDAKVVLNRRRDVETWRRSYAATVDPLVSDWWYSFRCYFDADAYWARRLVRDVQELHYDGDFASNAVDGYDRHYAQLREAATSQNREALEWTVEDGWAPLCEFLGKPIPDVAFPRGNDKDAFEAEKIRVTVERFARCDWNMRLVLGGVVAVLATATLLAVRTLLRW